jgi:hypothetical protein
MSAYSSIGRIWAYRLLVILLVVRVAPAHARGLAGGGVEVTLVGGAAESSDLRRLLAEWDDALEIRLSNRLNAGDILNGTAATGQLRIWVVLSSSELAIIYFKDSSGERFLVREVPLAAGLDESGRETLAQVIATSASAFVDRQAGSSASEVEASFRQHEMAKVPPQAPRDQAGARPSLVARTDGGHLRTSGLVTPTEVRKPASQPPQWRPHLGAFYSATLVGPREIGHGAGVSLGAARLSQASRWYLAAQAQYRFPLSIDDAGITLTLRTLALSAVVAWERTIVKAWFLGFELGLGVERTGLHATAAASSGVAPRHDAVHFRPIAAPGLRAGSDLGALRLALSLGVEVSPLQTHYDVVGRFYTPWIVQPRSAFELYW